MCPTNEFKESFFVVAHNPQTSLNNDLLKILLPSSNYRAQIFNKKGFEDIPSDVFEEHHYKKNGQIFVDYSMYIKSSLAPDELVIFKILQGNENKSSPEK